MPPRRIIELRGLGPTSEKLLARIDIYDEEQLRAIGATEAFARIRMTSEVGVSLNLLYALEGALTGQDWRKLSPEQKQSLSNQLTNPSLSAHMARPRT